MSFNTRKKEGRDARRNAGGGKRSGSMIRIPESAHNMLRDMSNETGQPMQDLLVEAVEEMRRRRMFDLANAAYAAMRENGDEWREELEERRLWDKTLADGLEQE